jgi:lipopolysaccharide export system permease protein
VNGNASPFLAVWVPNIVYTFIAIYLYRKAPR